jgi:hypothetical protein
MIYFWIVITSSTLSVVWHLYREPKNFLYWLDYGFAFLWTFMDIIISIHLAPLKILLTIVILNMIVFIMNKLGDYFATINLIDYKKTHVFWHLASSSKSIFIAYLLHL